mmetsp:Transcript_25457/g.30891  ORF Transcript_25457/g.30891 Transcript_25457/m.30891 type:complete len:94 (-) Transcript_25457:305-586(-)
MPGGGWSSLSAAALVMNDTWRARGAFRTPPADRRDLWDVRREPLWGSEGRMEEEQAGEETFGCTPWPMMSSFITGSLIGCGRRGQDMAAMCAD